MFAEDLRDAQAQSVRLSLDLEAVSLSLLRALQNTANQGVKTFDSQQVFSVKVQFYARPVFASSSGSEEDDEFEPPQRPGPRPPIVFTPPDPSGLSAELASFEPPTRPRPRDTPIIFIEDPDESLPYGRAYTVSPGQLLEGYRTGVELYRNKVEDFRIELESSRKTGTISMEEYQEQIDSYVHHIEEYRESIALYREMSSLLSSQASDG